MKMIKAEGLTYEYTKIMETDHGTEEHKVAALKSVNIEIEKGEFIVVLGHNGSGKSTLMKIIAGIDKSYQGEVVFSPGYTVGYLEQEPQLDPSKTVKEIVEGSK